MAPGAAPRPPEGTTGWIDAADVRLEERTERIVVDLSERTLWHLGDGDLRHRFDVGLGTPTYPTTAGRFSVWAFVRYADPTGPYATFALGLSGFSDVITDRPGGGRMAITARPRRAIAAPRSPTGVSASRTRISRRFATSRSERRS